MASPLLTSDLDAIFADPFFSVPVAVGAQTTRGVLDWTEVINQDGAALDVLVRQRTLTIRTGTLTLAKGASITVDGVAYLVREFQRRDDGLLTDIVLVS